MTQRAPALVTPFWVRVATETSLSPGWLLVAFPAVLYPAYLALEALFGRGLAAAMDFAGDIATWMVLAWAIGLGYASMMSSDHGNAPAQPTPSKSSRSEGGASTAS